MQVSKPRVPAVAGWFTLGDPPHLVGARCTQCGVVAFPPNRSSCPDPRCSGADPEPVPLARTGRVWSYTDARYQPPPPYVSRTDPYEPFVLAAVELDAGGIVVLGQMADGCTLESVHVGQPVELVVEPLFDDAEAVHLVWRWRPQEATGA